MTQDEARLLCFTTRNCIGVIPGASWADLGCSRANVRRPIRQRILRRGKPTHRTCACTKKLASYAFLSFVACPHYALRQQCRYDRAAARRNICVVFPFDLRPRAPASAQYIDAVRSGDIERFKCVEKQCAGRYSPTLDRGEGAALHFAVDAGQLNMARAPSLPSFPVRAAPSSLWARSGGRTQWQLRTSLVAAAVVDRHQINRRNNTSCGLLCPLHEGTFFLVVG